MFTTQEQIDRLAMEAHVEDFEGQGMLSLSLCTDIILVVNGHVDLFCCEQELGEPLGALTHIHRVEAGEFIFGLFCGAATERFDIFARGTIDAQILELIKKAFGAF